MAPVGVDGGDRRGRSASRHLGLQKKKSSDSSRRGQRLKKKTIKDDDSDDFVLTDMGEQVCGREMTQAEGEIYRKQVEETGGFDVVDVPTDVIDGNFIHPKKNFEKDPQLLQVINGCSMKAIAVYNRKHKLKGKYKFVRVLKLCLQLVAGFKYYITFEAKDEAADPVCFQAVVYYSRGEMEVLSCHLKP